MQMAKALKFDDLNFDDQKLVAEALHASARGYAPYSGFAVGAAVRAERGRIVVGANLENASYPQGICAEISAISAANARGVHRITAIAVVGHKFTFPEDTSQVVTPCGRCRQVIFEASQVSGHDILVLSCNATLTKIVPLPISALLPIPFGPANLGLDKAWPNMRSDLRNIVLKLSNREVNIKGHEHMRHLAFTRR